MKLSDLLDIIASNPKYEKKYLIEILREGLENDNVAQAVVDMYNAFEDTKVELCQ